MVANILKGVFEQFEMIEFIFMSWILYRKDEWNLSSENISAFLSKLFDLIFIILLLKITYWLPFNGKLKTKIMDFEHWRGYTKIMDYWN